MAMANPNILEVTDQTFRTAVLEESRRRPVVVDFWAAWCQPCHLIGPVLERLATEANGDFLLAKLDVDANPEAAAAFRIQSIPAVKAFQDGRLVSEFVGAIPEQSIRQFLRTVLPTEADRIVGDAIAAESQGHIDQAEKHYDRARTLEPDHPTATLGLARLAAMRGESDRARMLLEPLRPDPEAERLLTAIEVSEWGAAPSDGDDPVARAERAAAEGRFGEALATFLREVESGNERSAAAREAMLKLFAVLGDDDPLTIQYRRKLSAALF
jgi:putative thioredoxin